MPQPDMAIGAFGTGQVSSAFSDHFVRIDGVGSSISDRVGDQGVPLDNYNPCPPMSKLFLTLQSHG